MVTMYAFQEAEQLKLEQQDMEKDLESTEEQISAMKEKLTQQEKQLEKLNETAELAKVKSLPVFVL
jgi:L-lactate utilization protein LutB